MTDDALIAFLTARLDEREAAAKAAELRFPGPWEQAENTDSPLPSAVTLYDSRDESVGVIRGSYAADHIARHDPARVLREVAAKRTIVRGITAALPLLPHGDPAYSDALLHILRTLATVDSDHPDYKPEWKP